MDHTNLREPHIANRAQGRKLTLTLYLTLVPVIVVAFGLLLYLNLNEFNSRIKELQDKHLKSDLEAITSLSRSPAFHHYFDYMQYEMGQEAAIALETIHTLLYEEIQISKKYRAQVMSITLASKQGNIIITKGSGQAPPDLREVKEYLNHLPATKRVTSKMTDETHITIAPIGEDLNGDLTIDSDSLKGYLIIQNRLPADNIQTLKRSVLIDIFAADLLMLLAFAIIVYLVSRKIVTPLLELSRQAAQFKISDTGGFRIFTDIQEFHQLEATLNQMTVHIQWEAEANLGLAGIATHLVDAKSVDDVCAIVLEQARKLTQSRFGYVGYIDQKSGFLVCPTMTRDIWESCNVSNKNIIFEKLTGLFGWVLDNKKPLLTNDSKSDPRSTGTPLGHIPIEKFLSVPALQGDRLLGQIAVANPKESYTPRHQQALEQLSTLLSIALNKFEMQKKEKEQESVIIEQSKNAAMGQMIGVIAHQWKQPVSVISVVMQGMEDAYSFGELDEKGMHTGVRQVMEQLEYMTRTIEIFRNFLKPSKEKVIFHACEAAIDILHLLEPQLKKYNIKVKINEHEHFSANGYPNEFKQAVMNIIVNAKDAIEERCLKGGEIEFIFEHDEQKGTIRIRDNAGGIPQELLPNKLFESYITTKGAKGTGLGLNICKVIIEEKMGGKLTAHNVDGGAEFVIELPLAKI